MKHYFQAEQLKYRHTSVAAITIGMPMFTALLAFWLTSSYFSVVRHNPFRNKGIVEEGKKTHYPHARVVIHT